MESWSDLKAKYPSLIPSRFGFECELGWLKILDRYFEVVDRELPEEAVYELRQVKEKLGGIRIYDHSDATAASVPIREAHALAEARAFHTCEYCGRPGVWSNRRGYLTTVCEEHAIRDGIRAEPCEAEPYTYRDENGTWWTYDVEADALVETEVPDWAR